MRKSALPLVLVLAVAPVLTTATQASASPVSSAVVVTERAAAAPLAAAEPTTPTQTSTPAAPTTPAAEPGWLTWLKGVFAFFRSQPKPAPQPAPTTAPAPAPAPSAGSSAGSSAVDPVVLQILQETNAFRAANGKPALKLDPEITKVAQDWTQHMADNNAFHHNPNYAKQVPVGHRGVAENIAAGYAPAAVTKGWIDSPGHRTNMLGNYTHIGIGYVVKPGSGYTRYYTQVFGNYPGRG